MAQWLTAADVKATGAKAMLAQIKLGRLGQVEELMGAILFPASNAAAMVTRTSLIVDGGWTVA